jgi:peptidyl-prolyl cis-trans isomerase C
MARAPHWIRRAARMLGWVGLAMAALAILGYYIAPVIDSLRQTEAVKRSEGAIVATANGDAIRSKATSERVRSILWRRGESWDALSAAERKLLRDEAVDALIDDQLLAQFTAPQAQDAASIRRASDDEFEQFLKQFPPPDEWRERMRMQGLDEPALRKRISEETGRLAAVENWLAQQPGRPAAAEARAWFDAHQAELTVPERVRASHIFLTSHDENKPDREPEIRELHRQLTAGEVSFEELARKRSEDEFSKLRAGDLGWFTRDRVPPEFAEKVFALPVGVLSPPFQSHLGWHILVVKEKQPRRPAALEDTKDEIAAMLESRWREDAVRRLAADLRAKAKVNKFADRMATISPE